VEKELEMNARARELPDEAKVAIMIVKNVLDGAMRGAISDHEVVAAIIQAVFTNKHATVRSLVHQGIKFFAGRIKAAGLNVADLQSSGRSLLQV
jgi:hypothetical protein